MSTEQRLEAVLTAHRLNTPVQCTCGWRETDGDPEPEGDRWAAHVAAEVRIWLASVLTDAREDAARAMSGATLGLPRPNIHFDGADAALAVIAARVGARP